MELTILCIRDKLESIGERHRNTILHLLNKKPKRIRIMCKNLHDFELDGNRMLSQELKKILVRGTKVSIILGEKPEKMKSKTVDFLQEIMDFGARVYHHPRAHAKFFISEGRNNEVDTIITSANFTATALHKNFELGFYFSNMDLKYSEIINNLFKHVLGLPANKSL